MSVQQSGHSHTRKQLLAFATITVLGVAALLLGLALILFVHYHERAYIFLGLGAGGSIGGIAGIVGAGSKTRTTLSYGAIALGMMGIVIGINYLTDLYGPAPNQTYGDIVIALSLVTILAGFVGALLAQPKGGMAAFSSVIMLGVIASLGIVAVSVGTIYLIVLQSQGRAYLLLGVGAVCLIGGIACGAFAQSRAGDTEC
jgi:hypothetical protein